MKLAIMQPYFFPYIGYFQLMYVADVFVVLDDVGYIQQGWINRNFMLMNCHPQRFSVPLVDASSFRPICETSVADIPWREKFLKSLKQAYTKAPQFSAVFALVETVVQKKTSFIGELALDSLMLVMDYLGLKRVIRSTSRVYENSHLRGQERIMDICLRERAEVYVNLPGGKGLYDRNAFLAKNIDLRFINTEGISYPQFGCEFVPNLSILDVLMFNEPSRVVDILRNHSLEC